MENIVNLASTFGIKILVALAIFFIGRKLANMIAKLSIDALKKSGVDETLEKFLSSVIYGFLIIVVILASLSQLGIETTSIVAMLGAVGLAIGLAFKDSLSNISAGIMIVIFKPIKIAELVEVAGELGTVEEINVFHTFLKTGDNKLIIISNSNVISSNIINYSRNETRRVDLTFAIGYEDDLKLAKSILESISKNDERILSEPQPLVAVSALADNSINFTVRVWTKSENYWNVFFDMNEKVKNAFDENNITIPYPQMSIHISKNEELS